MTIDCKEVFQLAQDKGYELVFIDVDKMNIYEPLELVLDSKNCLLLELTLIQKWLRDEFEYNVIVKPTDVNVSVCYYQWEIITTAFEKIITNQIIYPSYENALPDGIHEALKLLP
jgi:hypothetical protein